MSDDKIYIRPGQEVEEVPWVKEVIIPGTIIPKKAVYVFWVVVIGLGLYLYATVGLKIIDFIAQDKTPISPVLLVILFILFFRWLGKIFKSAKDEKDKQLYNALWIAFGILAYSCYFYFWTWFGTLLATFCMFMIISLIYKKIRKWEKNPVPRKHELIPVLLLARRKTWLMVFLLVIDMLLLPVAIVFYTNPLSWWNIVVVLASYVSGVMLSYAFWRKTRFTQEISIEEVSALPNAKDTRSSRKNKK